MRSRNLVVLFYFCWSCRNFQNWVWIHSTFTQFLDWGILVACHTTATQNIWWPRATPTPLISNPVMAIYSLILTVLDQKKINSKREEGLKKILRECVCPLDNHISTTNYKNLLWAWFHQLAELSHIQSQPLDHRSRPKCIYVVLFTYV